MTGQLVLLRHGESTANANGTFTGLLDVPLTPEGERQAVWAAEMLRANGVTPTIVVTSTLQRAVRTADLVTHELRLPQQATKRWELNERNYGALTGQSKTTARAALGEVEFTRVRRSLTGRPPKMTFRNWWTLRHTPALRGLPRRAVRRTESLSDVVRRVCPLYETDLLPVVLGGATVLVVAHGNSLRALCACIDDLTEKEVADLNLPTGQPLLYRVGEDRALHPRGGEYLDPTADDAAALVAAEGGT